MCRLLYDFVFTCGAMTGAALMLDGELASGGLYLGLSWPWAYAAAGYQPFVLK